MDLFADVILPLAIPRPYTYRLDPEIAAQAEPGMRVVAELGNGKLYTGLIINIHNQDPGKHKTVSELLDDKPIVLPNQMKFWQWMSSYYMCGLGDVMNAALPSGLKLSSETFFCLNDATGEFPPGLHEKSYRILETLYNKSKVSLQDVESLLSIKHVRKYVNALLAQGLISVFEEVQHKYKPAIERRVGLHPDLQSDGAMQAVFNELEASARNAKQVDALLMVLRDLDGNLGGSILKRELVEVVGDSAVKTLMKKGILQDLQTEISRITTHEASKLMFPLNEAQRLAMIEVKHGFGQEKVTLLHGVTSSGKTEIYAHLIREAMDREEQILYLVPEIALTTQLIERLRKYFGDQIAVYHSRYSTAERTELWFSLLNQKTERFKIILGARSALFLPFSKLGLVIIDEEHETSYKQHDPAPRYHARDSAIWLAHQHGAKVLLGSATPSLEAWGHARSGKFHYVELNTRYAGIKMPRVDVVDMRQETKAKRVQGGFSQALLNSMQRVIEAGKQVILFQNRRGFSPFLQCEDCGHVQQCHHCDVALTYHKGIHMLKCHYCGASEKPGTECGNCGSGKVHTVGFGTERVEEELLLLQPNWVSARLDLETTRSKTAYERILTDFANGEIQVLIGTQMITKGLDFANVALVGVLSADRMLNFQDFRAHERAFQLMEQVSGRAGRSGDQGEVIIQAFSPDHWVLNKVMQHDVRGMLENEMMIRRNFSYPPFVRMVQLTLMHKDEELVVRTARELVQRLNQADCGEVLGPTWPPVRRVRDQYHQVVLVKLPVDNEMMRRKKSISTCLNSLQIDTYYRKVRVVPNVDPM